MLERDRRNFHTLDALRGVAAIFIVMFHYEGMFCNAYDGYAAGDGYLAVDFFFALSGFVISHAYAKRLNVGLKSTTFTKIRLIRLYPLHFVGSVFGVVSLFLSLDSFGLLSSSTPALQVSIVAQFLMLPSWPMLSSSFFMLNQPTWSLFFELIINVFLALFWRHVSNVRILIVILVAAVGLILMSHVVKIHGDRRGPDLENCDMRISARCIFIRPWAFAAFALSDRQIQTEDKSGAFTLRACRLFTPWGNATCERIL